MSEDSITPPLLVLCRDGSIGIMPDGPRRVTPTYDNRFDERICHNCHLRRRRRSLPVRVDTRVLQEPQGV